MRAAIRQALKNKGCTVYFFCKEYGGISQTLFDLYLSGSNVVSVKNIERIFSILGISIEKEDIKETTFHPAICKAFASSGASIYSFAKECGIYPSSLSRYLKNGSGLETANIAKVCERLGLRFIVPNTETRQRKPRKQINSFAIGSALSSILKAKGISVYRFCKDNGFNASLVGVFLRTGGMIGSGTAERLLAALGAVVTDGTAVFGSDFRAAIQATMQKQGKTRTALRKETGLTTVLDIYLAGKCNMGMKKVDKVFKALGLYIQEKTTKRPAPTK